MAPVLTAQVDLGAALGIAGQIFLVWFIIGHVMPFFGLELLDMAEGGRLQSPGAGGAAFWGQLLRHAQRRSERPGLTGLATLVSAARRSGAA